MYLFRDVIDTWDIGMIGIYFFVSGIGYLISFLLYLSISDDLHRKIDQISELKYKYWQDRSEEE